MTKPLWVIKIGGQSQGVSEDEETAKSRARELASEGVDTAVYKRVKAHDYFFCAYDGSAEKAGLERRVRGALPSHRRRLSALAERVGTSHALVASA